MAAFDFTDEEIKEELRKLGYYDVSEDRLHQFKQDLEELVTSERSRSSFNSGAESTDAESPFSGRVAGVKQPGYSDYAGYTAAFPYTDWQREAIGRPPAARASPPRPAYGGAAVPEGAGRYGGHGEQGETILTATDVEDASLLAAELNQVPHEPRVYVTGASRAVDDRAPSPAGRRAPSPAESDASSRRVVKRKVVRRVNGARVVDESYTESETDMSGLVERLALDAEARPGTAPPRVRTSRSMPQFTPRSSHSAALPSYIRPSTGSSEATRRSDPVARYQQYQRGWHSQRAPGEASRKALRWSVREVMVGRDPQFKKPQRMYEANTYVVPTEKKRQALRWRVRSEMAQGLIPSSAGYWEC